MLKAETAAMAVSLFAVRSTSPLAAPAVAIDKTELTRDVPAGQTFLGMPPQGLRRELKCISIYQRLPELAKDVKQLSKKIEKLETAKDNKI